MNSIFNDTDKNFYQVFYSNWVEIKVPAGTKVWEKVVWTDKNIVVQRQMRTLVAIVAKLKFLSGAYQTFLKGIFSSWNKIYNSYNSFFFGFD